MATSLAGDPPSLTSQLGFLSPEQNDPFLSPPSGSHHRFSHFDSQLFALGPTTSPDQAKRTLEAHLAETERRIEDTSKLGTTLVQQRKELADRLKEVEKQQSEGEITPELRQKLSEIEREYNEVGKETARAFLPKSRVSSSELGESPFNQKVAHTFPTLISFPLTCHSDLRALPSSKVKLPALRRSSVSQTESRETSLQTGSMILNSRPKLARLSCRKSEISKHCSQKRTMH